VIPPRPGVLSTWGLLDTDIRATFVRTAGIAERRASDVDAPRLEAAWIALESEARTWLDGEQVPRDRQRFERGADLRYEHQSFELTCPLGDGPLTPARLEELIRTFHAEHRRLYSYDLPRAQVELVNLRVTAIGVLPKRAMPSTGMPASADLRSAVVGERAVYFRAGGTTSVPVYARDRLASGMTFAGPAIVDQDDATCLIAPDFRARVDGAHNLLLERSHA
jgi:N-methylhydantoinase A